ncbi:MAG: hypothetical protein M1814_003494 [Vezdaea aestivalis]|nr:MAG: hypothetical protein M1814_003494 [Vezdaea aestivalis]
MQASVSGGTVLRSPHNVAPGQSYTYHQSPRKYSVPATAFSPSGSTSYSSDSGSSSTTVNNGSESSTSSRPYPFLVRNGRRYIKDTSLTYPLPCDTAELHRQIFRTLLLNDIFGAPLCSLDLVRKPPKRVLEVACGTGIWSSLCHEYFSKLGYDNVSFTGIDVAPIAPDLADQGVNWHFVQHDLRKLPLPFADGEFDMVFVKDLSMVTPITGFQEKLMTEYLRVLRSGGIFEAWDSDHVLRTLAGPSSSHGTSKYVKEQVERTATYNVSPGTSFGPAQNPYIKDYNSWLQQALDAKRLTSCPCTLIGPLMLQEVDDLEVVSSRRMAILFGDVRWEREGIGGKRGRSRQGGPKTRAQMALRRGALLTVVQMMESMEPLLRQYSLKSQEEWDHWWASMMEDLLENNGTEAGECLEVGAWWGRKT